MPDAANMAAATSRTSSLYHKAQRYFGALAARHPSELGSLKDDPGEYFDRLWKAKGLDRQSEKHLPEEEAGYRAARQAFVDGCERSRAEPEAWQEVERVAKVATDWAEAEHAAGRRVWGTPVPRAVLRAHGVGVGPPRMLSRSAPRARGAGRPAARPAARGGDSGDGAADSDEPPDGPTEPALGGHLVVLWQSRWPP
jgi:hypothetical protein